MYEGVEVKEECRELAEAPSWGLGRVFRLRRDSLGKSLDSHQACSGSRGGSSARRGPCLNMCLTHVTISNILWREAKSDWWRHMHLYTVRACAHTSTCMQTLDKCIHQW